MRSLPGRSGGEDKIVWTAASIERLGGLLKHCHRAAFNEKSLVVRFTNNVRVSRFFGWVSLFQENAA